MTKELGPLSVMTTYHKEYKRRFPERFSVKRMPSLKKTVDVQTALEFLRWCEEQEIEEPLIFMELVFAFCFTKGAFPPRFNSLRNEGLLDTYDEALGSILENRRLKAEAANHPMRQHYSALALNTKAHENVRSRYADRRLLCEADFDASGGYHPQSGHCTACPQATSCATRLNVREGFDVVSLRMGRTDKLPADVRALIG